MSSLKPKQYLGKTLLGLLCLIGLAFFIWLNFMQEREWKTAHYQSDEAARNPYLASQLWLEQHAHPVHKIPAFNKTELSKFKSGTLLYGATNNAMTASLAQDVLKWVEQGNTLIMTPTYHVSAGKDEQAGEQAGEQDAASKTQTSAEAEEDEIEQHPTPEKGHVEELELDPIAAYFGVALEFYSGKRKPQKSKVEERIKPVPFKEEPEVVKTMRESHVKKQEMYLPGLAYNLNIQFYESFLINYKDMPELLLYDQSKQLVQAHPHGKGRVIFLASNYFQNHSLNRLDHAELLLHLIPAKQTVYLVNDVEAAPWWRLLWQHYFMPLIALMFLSALWFWRVKSRFGSLLPDPQVDRRAVLEHIRACGRWMWQSKTGRQTLLDAMRLDVRQLLQRRAPDVLVLSDEEQVQRLAQAAGISQQNLKFAYLETVANNSKDFTLQIKILKLIRTHYER